MSAEESKESTEVQPIEEDEEVVWKKIKLLKVGSDKIIFCLLIKNTDFITKRL